jgi:hypothetical protein
MPVRCQELGNEWKCRYLAAMNPTVEAAWIAMGGAVTGVGGAVAVAITGYRNTRKATVSCD